jgi:rhodanese-related sulfurtransferase
MQTRLVFLFAFLIMGITAQAQTVEKDSIRVISIEEFEKMTTKKRNILLDVRTPEEVADGHLAGSLNINFLGENFAREISTLNKNKTYLLYCRSGSRTRKAIDQMQKAGFRKVYMMEGGIIAWNEAGKPTVK